jgi:uncharacterized repeat protein (TIGR01451 family)
MINKKYVHQTFVCMGLLLLMSTTPAVEAQAGELLSLDSKHVDLGDEFLVNVYVSNFEDVEGASFDILYDPAILQVNSVTANSRIPGSSLTLNLDNAGTITVVAVNSDYITALDTTPFIDISFKAIANGTSKLEIQNVELTKDFTPYTPSYTNGEVKVGNLAPVLDAIDSQSVDELAELNFIATANDSDVLAFSLSGSVPIGASITSDGVFTWTPTESQGPASYTFDVVVSDGILTDKETITVIVSEVNVAPVLDSIGSRTVDELTELNFTATANDVDLPANTLTFSLSGSVPVGAFITSDGVFTWTPTETQGSASYTFDVVVSDGILTDNETITVTVYEDNFAPVLGSIGSLSVDELTELNFTATATDSDALTFSLSGTVPTGASITSDGVFTWTPTESQGPASYAFDVVVSDGSLSDNETIAVTVNEVNVAPVLAAIGFMTVDELSELNFTATATDVDLPANTLTFSLSGSVPAGASITFDGVFIWTPTEAQGPGSYTFDVEVSDGDLTDNETIIVTVSEDNFAPVLDSIGSQSVDELTELNFTATATDSDELTFSLSGTVPTGASITSDGMFIWTPTEAQGPNSYTFDVVVSDGSLTDNEAITVTVNEVNVAPVLAAIGSQNVDELTELSFTATASDADLPANVLTFSLSDSVPTGASITSDGVFTWTPTEAQGPGSYTFDVEVSDGEFIDNETITVTVSEVNSGPVQPVLPVADFTVDVTSGDAPLTVKFTDKSTNANIWSWDVNGDGVEDSNLSTFEYTYTNAGTYNVFLTVTNNDGSDTKTELNYISVSEPAELLFSMTDDEDKVVLGEELTYKTSLTNTRSTELTNVQIIDTLPSGLEFVSSNGGTFDNVTNTVTFDIVSVKPSETIAVKVVAKTTSYGDIINSATMTCDQDALSCEDETSVVTQEEIPEFPSIAIPLVAIVGLSFVFMRRRE